ncbi:TPA: hypothetical protein ACJKBV_001184 [Neisseria meningitidis]
MPSETFRQQAARSTPCGFFLRISAAKAQTLKLPTPFFAFLFFDTRAFVLFPAIPKTKSGRNLSEKQQPFRRHSRESGNLGLSVRKRIG